MRKTILLAAVAGMATVPLAATPANAQYYGSQLEYQREYNAELRECNRELRRSDTRREYIRELAECQRELADERREYARDVRRDYNRYYGSSRYGYAPAYSYPRGYSGYAYPQTYAPYGTYTGSGGPYAPVYDYRLGMNDTVYRGRDGRYYCRRSNGTTGLIVGGAAGALLGRALIGRGSRTIGALIGGAAGAALGREIARGNVSCR